MLSEQILREESGTASEAERTGRLQAVPRGDYFVICIINHLQFLFDDVRLQILGRSAGKSKLPNGRRPRHHVITLITSQFISVSHFGKSERYIMSVFHISYYIIPTT